MIIPAGESRIHSKGQLITDAGQQAVCLYVTERRIAVDAEGRGVLFEFTLDAARSARVDEDARNVLVVQFKSGNTLPTIRLDVRGPRLASALADAIRLIVENRPKGKERWDRLWRSVRAAAKADERDAEAAAREAARGPLRTGHWKHLKCPGACKDSLSPSERLDLDLAGATAFRCVVCGWTGSAEALVRHQGYTTYVPAVVLFGLAAPAFWFLHDSWLRWPTLLVLVAVGLAAYRGAAETRRTLDRISAARTQPPSSPSAS